ncbi:hypothetical protein K461DRAFT_319107 [Myriangium duriaei CBS 260.36]|uniref:Uncharacterized protein n=1 Tax=Myriangium duriaei CBS 260.36 TaxID=1168546 RepID=A0A9P4J938_9PEZI|nr:hypothetical protein K461DRAFT_319107 [Myriangium duriaei CBS 260.36]
MARGSYNRFHDCKVTTNHHQLAAADTLTIEAAQESAPVEEAGEEPGDEIGEEPGDEIKEVPTMRLRPPDRPSAVSYQLHLPVRHTHTEVQIAFTDPMDAVSVATVAAGLVEVDKEHAVFLEEAEERARNCGNNLLAEVEADGNGLATILDMKRTAGMVLSVLQKMVKGSAVWGKEEFEVRGLSDGGGMWRTDRVWGESGGQEGKVECEAGALKGALKGAPFIARTV